MTLRINDEAPNFTAKPPRARSTFTSGSATAGRSFFPTPKTSRPSARPSWATWPVWSRSSRSATAKIIGLSVDPVSSHGKWAADIEETQGHKVTYPHDRRPGAQRSPSSTTCSRPTQATTSDGRTAANNATVRTVFVIGPDKKIKLMLSLPDEHRPQLRRSAARARLHATHGEAPGRDAGELEAGRRRHHRAGRVR